MTINKFQGKTEEEAIEKAKSEMGPGVVIMNVKLVKPTGLFGFLKTPHYEVTAAMEEKDPQTLKGKLAKLKKEWDDPNGKFLKTITAVGAVAGLATTLYNGSKSLHLFGSDAKSRSKKSQENIQGLYNFLNNNKVDVNSVNDVEAKLAARKFEQGCYQEALSIATHNSNELTKGYGFVMRIFGNKKDQLVVSLGKRERKQNI